MYKIKKYSYRQAKKLGLQIVPSSKKNKKIDVYKNGVLQSSIGAKNYLDYPSYMELEKRKKVVPGTAKKRQQNFRKRHKCRQAKKGSNNFFACKILW